MTVIEASSGTYRSRVDGTIVLSVEIEPRFRAEALALFGMPGTPIAIAALKTQKAEPKTVEPIGPYCRNALQLCEDKRFWEWIHVATLGVHKPENAYQASKVMKEDLRIASRRELDTDPEACALYEKRFVQPFARWLIPG